MFLTFFWEFSDVYLDVNNYDNPIKIIGADFYTSVSKNGFKHIDFYL